MVVLVCSLCDESWGNSCGKCLCSFKNCFFVCYYSVGHMTASPVDFQSQVFWDPVPQVGSLKVGAPYVWSKPFTPREKLGVGGSLLIVWHCARGGVYSQSVSQLSLWI